MPWDKNIDYEYIYHKLERDIARNKKRLEACYASILLIQLRNGARISEAVRAYQKYIITKQKEIMIKVSKKKHYEERLMIIPEVKICTELSAIREDKLINRLKMFAKRKYNINTHSLRYAFITYLLRNAISPALIAKITKHKSLEHILTYTQQKAAEEILRNMTS